MEGMSNGEKKIAEILTKYNIDFVFEYPLLIKEKYNDKEIKDEKIWAGKQGNRLN